MGNNAYWIYCFTICYIRLFEIISRSETDLYTFNNRLFLTSIISYLSSFDIAHLFGHRLYFQPDSFKLYSLYNTLNTNSVYFSFHNSFLQLLIQIGYFEHLFFYHLFVIFQSYYQTIYIINLIIIFIN